MRTIFSIIFLSLSFSLFCQDDIKVVTKSNDTIYTNFVYEGNNNSIIINQKNYLLLFDYDSVKCLIQKNKEISLSAYKFSNYTNNPYNEHLSSSSKTGVAGAGLLLFGITVPILNVFPNIDIQTKTAFLIVSQTFSMVGTSLLINAFIKLDKASRKKPIKIF
jgi:hypothetical protein